MNGGIILRIEHISKNFGAIRAVDDVSLDILDGEMHAIIGSNGAGKSTLMDLVCRRTIPSSGKVVFCDEDISVLPAHEIANRGMCKCFQISKLFGELKAFENVRIALVKRAGRTYDFLPKKKDFLKKEAIEVLRSVGLADKADETASLLSYGDQRRLEIAITLALEPRLLILDFKLTLFANQFFLIYLYFQSTFVSRPYYTFTPIRMSFVSSGVSIGVKWRM